MEQNLFFVLFFFVIALVTPVQAWDPAGDTIALLLGILIGFLALFAGLGWYARRNGAA